MNHTGNGRGHLREFFLFPVLFFLLSYLILFLLFSPFLGAFSSASNLLFFSDGHPIGKPAENIFTSAPETSPETVKLSSIQFPSYGARFGKLTISSASIEADLYFGDGSAQLKNGVGIYNGSFIPGYGKTILVAGHNHTFFHTLGNAKAGDEIRIETNYGTYLYRIDDAQVKKATDASAYDLASTKENLVLYTCYPFDELGLTPERYYVYAEYVSGPKIDKQE